MQTCLPLILVLSGSANVLLIKWANQIEAKGSDDLIRPFDHPILQTAAMFSAQLLCLFIFKSVFSFLQRKRDGSEDVYALTAGGREFSLKIFLVPAICDVISSSMMFIGLMLTYASSFQMLRGCLVIFISSFTVIILNQSLKPHQCFGMLTISLGTILVSVADVDKNSLVGEVADVKARVTGDLLIICAQIFQAVQLVYEEKYVKTLDIPALQSVGWEGFFGLLTTLLILIPVNFIKIGPPFDRSARGVLDDLPDAIIQLSNSSFLIIAHVLFIFSIIIYNYSVMTLTKMLSATNTVIIDTVRILFIWIFSLGFGWEQFHVLELVGYLVLLSGIFIYRNVVFVQSYRWILVQMSRRRYDEFESEQVTSQPADG